MRETYTCKKVTYDRKRILSITTTGIQYIDNGGKECFVDFQLCRKNWVEYVNRSADFAATDLSESDTTCVAWRDWFSTPPYIEFFTEPRIRFEFDGSSSIWGRLITRLRRTALAKNWRDFQQRVNQAGWTTFDLG